MINTIKNHWWRRKRELACRLIMEMSDFISMQFPMRTLKNIWMWRSRPIMIECFHLRNWQIAFRRKTWIRCLEKKQLKSAIRQFRMRTFLLFLKMPLRWIAKHWISCKGMQRASMEKIFIWHRDRNIFPTRMVLVNGMWHSGKRNRRPTMSYIGCS